MQTVVTRAFLLASELHANQKRKAPLVPGTAYMGHLMEVAGMVMASGAPDVAVAAALLHDAIEDQGKHTRAIILEQLGSEVLALVEECTEQGTGEAIKPPWRERKDAALANLSRVSLLALLILVADKLQNARDVRRVVALRGESAYTLFRAGKEGTLWFQEQVVLAMKARLAVLRHEYPDEPLLFPISCLIIELGEVAAFLRSQ